ncbi:MAG: flagellar protein [Selenomonadaceae bacterium]|nr:flagellar protein [Selenomonadaceae bacterium]
MAAKLRNCISCGKIFSSLYGEKMCPSCKEAQDRLENSVIDYVRANPKTRMPEIVKETGATDLVIRRLMEAGRLVGVNLKYPCKKCGKDINRGQFCESCAKEIEAEVQNVSDKAAAARAAAERGRGIHSKDSGGRGKGK